MAIEGELTGTEKLVTCRTCYVAMPLSVLLSAAGHYIGRSCDCGPHSRETSYYSTIDEAQADLSILSRGGQIDTLRNTHYSLMKPKQEDRKNGMASR